MKYSLGQPKHPQHIYHVILINISLINPFQQVITQYIKHKGIAPTHIKYPQTNTLLQFKTRSDNSLLTKVLENRCIIFNNAFIEVNNVAT